MGINFSDLKVKNEIHLYAGDISPIEKYPGYIGLSLTTSDDHHIKHDITQPYPIEDMAIDRYQSEDVFEHIEYVQLPSVINEIHRVLKINGLFRLSLPDYRCDILYERTQKNEKGDLLFDPGGGGYFVDNKVVEGGHVWFPTYRMVKNLLKSTKFTNITFLHYYDEDGRGITNKIDYTKGFVKRTPDNDNRVKYPYRPMSIVVDCVK